MTSENMGTPVTGDPARPDAVFATDDELGSDLAAVDWAATPLGPTAEWPQSLRTAVNILVSSRFSMWMAWGPELTFFCNAAYRHDTLGQKYPWALGRPASQVWEEIWDDIGPRIGHVLTSGSATWDRALLLFLERSGSTEETYHTFSYSPLRDDQGLVVGMLCVVTEDTDGVIGERRMATLRDLGSDPSVVRTEQEMLDFASRQLAGNTLDLPFTLTYLFEDDNASRARLAAATGISRGHPIASETLSAEQPDRWWPVEAVVAGEATLIDLTVPGLPTGGWPLPPTQALLLPLLQQGGAPLGFLVAALNRYRPLDAAYRGFLELAAGHVASGVLSARNYQAQQQRAEELAALDRAKTTFFSNISHEFRTPLTLINGPVQELRTLLADAPPVVREELDVVHRNGLRLGKLVNALLDFSRIEAGRMQARYEPADLAAVTSELASVFRSAMDKAGLRFEVDCRHLDEPVYLDRDMWEKVVLNLLSNALKFTFDGGVTVRLRTEDGQAVLTVADTGVGVAASEMPRLFERFHRIADARSRSSEGSGIGLALVKELVGLHGGDITAESTEGRGTSFTIRLPFGHAHLPPEAVAEVHATSGPSAVAEPYVHEALRWVSTSDDAPRRELAADPGVLPPDVVGLGMPARVLIADDNADMREYLARLLGGAGHQVDTAVDGQAALEQARADPPDLVVSDVMMPRLDGLGLVAALRADERTASVPVLLLSARAGQEAAIQGLEAGADDYLVKPFPAAELLARVRANVELARLRTRHARWRTALVDSLQEGFFVCAADGAVMEINARFAEIVGHGSAGLPYALPHPWWPDAVADPHGHRQAREVFAGVVESTSGEADFPLVNREGQRVWLRATYNRVEDPSADRHVIVGTVRDITAERYAARRDAALGSLADQLASADSVPQALDAAARELQRTWAAERVVLAAFPTAVDDKQPRLFHSSDGAQWTDIDSDLAERLQKLRSAEPLASEVDDDNGSAGIAVGYPGGVLVASIDLGRRRLFAAPDQTLLEVLAGRLGHGLHRVHEIDQQREAAVALQHAILGPASLPGGFAVRYQPATRPLQVGGDWYDTVPVTGNRIGIVVGDCVGHGLEAAAVMGQLRSACRALLLEHAAPARALAGLDQFAALLPGAKCTTVFCAVLDPVTGELVYSSAGHPPPVLVSADGATTTVQGGHGIPLGLHLKRPRTQDHLVIAPRATLLLYTDGLVERRRRPLDEGIDRAAGVLHDGRNQPVEDLASDLMSALAPAGGYQDDVALLVYRQPGPLEIDFEADAGELAPVRHALRDWLNRCDVGVQLLNDVLIAAGEACVNAVEHGHRGRPEGRVRLRAVAVADQLWIRIMDNGSWKIPDPQATAAGHRGRGIALMQGLMQHVTIQPSSTGTIVEMHARITS